MDTVASFLTMKGAKNNQDHTANEDNYRPTTSAAFFTMKAEMAQLLRNER